MALNDELSRLSDRRSVRRSIRLRTVVALGLVALLLAVLCGLAVLSEPPSAPGRVDAATVGREP